MVGAPRWCRIFPDDSTVAGVAGEGVNDEQSRIAFYRPPTRLAINGGLPVCSNPLPGWPVYGGDG